MIIVNTFHIGKDEPLHLEGTEEVSILDLPADDGMFRPVGEVSYDLFATMAGQDLLVTGKAWFSAVAECARCLKKFTLEVKAPKLCLLFEKAAEQEKDVTPDVREELLLAIPAYFHCNSDCKGICAGCGKDLNTEKCTCGSKNAAEKSRKNSDDAPSPWDALDAIKR